MSDTLKAESVDLDRAQVAEAGSEAARVLILANPKAGGLKSLAGEDDPSGEKSLAALEAAVKAAGVQATVEASPKPEQVKERVRKAQEQGYDTVVAAGGDGTIRVVVQALMDTPLRLGILPVGTANNFARSLGIPFEVEKALQVLAAGKERTVDVGCIGKEIFTEAAGVGLFVSFLAAFGPNGPRLRDFGRAWKIIFPLWWNPPARHVRLVLDGEAYAEEAVMVSVCNSPYTGAKLELAPEAKLDDGLFDVMIIGALSRWELLRLAIALKGGNDLKMPKVNCIRAKRVEISRARQSRHALSVHADDHITTTTPAQMEILPGALRVVVP